MLDGFLRSFLVIGTVATLVPLDAGAQILVTRGSSPELAIDTSLGLTAGYVAYRLTNSGASAQPALWVTIGSFTGGVVSLAPHARPEFFVGDLEAGSEAHAYFYVTASAATTSAQTHTVSLHEGSPWSAPFATAQFSLTFVNTLTAISSQITSLTLEPMDLKVGSTFHVTVGGQASSISAGVAAWTPAASPGFRADVFELRNATVTLTIGGCSTPVFISPGDLLVDLLSSSAGACHVAIYEFVVKRAILATSTLRPLWSFR